MSTFIDSKREKVLFWLLGLTLAGVLAFLIVAWPGFSGADQEENHQAGDPEQDLALSEMLPHSEGEYQQALDLAHAFTTEYLRVDGSEDHSERQERLAQFGTPSYAEFLRNETPPAASPERTATEFAVEGQSQQATITELDSDSLTFTMRTTSIVHNAEGSHEEEAEFLLTVEMVSGEWGVSSLRATEAGSL